MRLWFAVAIVLVAVSVKAQSNLGGAVKPFFKRMASLGYLPDPPNPNPNPVDPKSQNLPKPAITDPQEPGSISDREIRIVHASKQRWVGSIITLEGGVRVRFRGYEISCEKLTGDTRTQIFNCEGSVSIIGSEAIVEGESISIDFKNETYVATQHRAILHPEATGGRTTGDLYIRGNRSHGSAREFFERDGSFTTCELDVPHYRIDAQSINVRPEKRIILRDTRFRVMGKTWLRIPYLSIPLDSRRDRYTPVVGQSRDEGYFIKTIWGVPIPGNSDLDVYLDYFTKLGVGLGGRYRYAGADYHGFLRAYGIQGNSDTMELSLGHRQLFGANMFQLESNLQRRNYLNAPENTTLQTRASLSIPQGRNSTRLSFYQNSNESDAFRSVNRTIGLTDDRRFGAATRWTLNANWVRSRTEFSVGDPAQREQVDVSFRGTHDFKRLLAELEYQRSIPIGDTANFFSGTDRTPVFSLRSDSRRLFGARAGERLPFTTELSVGEFANSSTSQRITRTFFDINVNKPELSNAKSALSYNARFRQSMYSDDTAQYSALVNLNYRYSFTRDTAFNVRYNYLEPTGYTPLSIDRVGRTHIASMDVSAKAARAWTIGVQSGYDFRYASNNLTTGWQQIAARLEYRPNDSLLARGLSIYDPNLKKWSTTRIDATYDNGKFYVGLGARYDGIRSQWSNVNLFADGLRWGKVTASVLFAYNGYTKNFDTRQYSLVYDLHCTEAVLQVLENNVGFRPGRQIYFFLRIKALPFATPFGTGTQGQPFGTSTGFGN